MGVFWRCLYHLIWTTKHREPSITPELEVQLASLTQGKCIELGVSLQAMGGIPDHIHMAVAIPPSSSVSDCVRLLKGYVAFQINAVAGNLSEKFRWQSGYGVLTFGEKQLDFVVQYIHNQKNHHAAATVHPLLEDSGSDD